MPRCSVTRRVHFNAAHRLYNPNYPDEWNRATFGKCANPNFHGHNYELDVAVEGELTKPEGSYAISKKKTSFKSLIKVRDNFVPELQKSVDNL